MEYLGKPKWDIRKAKFIAHLRKKHKEIKAMSKTDKIIVPEVVGKNNAALKDEKMSNPDAKIEASE